MWLFESPKTYTEVCKKIAQAVFYISLIELFVLSQISVDFANFMKRISFDTETVVFDVKFYLAYIYIPIILSVLENVFKLHDRIGRIFALRERFEGYVLFVAYMKMLDVRKPQKGINTYRVFKKHERLKKCLLGHFYYYVSDTNPRVDEHDIQMALDSWCWVWIFLDCIAISVLLCVASIIVKVVFGWNINIWLVFGLLIYSALLVGLVFLQLFTNCKKYAIKEVAAAVEQDKKAEKNERNIKLKQEIQNALHYK